jgi:hypothetical protein
MGRLRFLLLPTIAALLVGCAAAPLLHPGPESAATTQGNTASNEVNAATAAPEADRHPAVKQTADEPVERSAKLRAPKLPLPKATSNTAFGAERKNATTPKVGSVEWKKDRADDERKERHLKEVIESICRGC